MSNGMITRVWGPPLWFTIHTISFNYPENPTEKEKSYYRDWFFSLKNVLPCKYCRSNFMKNIKETGFSEKHLKNRQTFSKFIYDFHNTVNSNTGKPLHSQSYKQVRDTFELYRAQCINNNDDGYPQKENGCIIPRNNNIREIKSHVKIYAKKIRNTQKN